MKACTARHPRIDRRTTARAAAAVVAAVASLAPLAMAEPAQAWDRTGHEVVARLAWETMSPAARARAVALLKAAPPDSDLNPPGLTPRELFTRASYWPDIVRDEKFPARRAKYSQPAWHYITWLWDQPSPEGPPRDLPDPPAPQDVVERLRHLTPSLADPAVPPAEKAIQLAWVLHLVGDVHQPLHCASRQTGQEPHGDQGANLFQLDAGHNLHAYWDSILTSADPQRPQETAEDYLGRLAARLSARHPRRPLAARLDLGHYEAWANEGYERAKTDVYLPSLARGHAPSLAYQQHAARIAEQAIALAGYRLAATLERVLAPPAGR
jgi:hypothetical protein